MKTDVQIQDHVLQELRWDSRVDAAEIGVAVQHGVVSLTGTVATSAERRAAEEAAFRVQGVHDVANDIQVRLPGLLIRTDADIAEAARIALEWNTLIPSDRITTTVYGGVVTLRGTVEAWQQAAEAERAVGNLAGVRDLVSELVVRAPTVASSHIHSEIKAALERRADRAASRVQVLVADGVVTLMGGVHSRADKDAVLAAARSTRGVHKVVDQLRIEHPEETPETDEHLHAQTAA